MYNYVMNNVIFALVSRDVKKAARAVNSLRNMRPTNKVNFSAVAIVNSKDDAFVRDFSAWADREGVEYRVTPSRGTASGGKNECLKFFRESNYDGMGLLDGDDAFYPTAGLQIERHLLHHPGTDVIIHRPSDKVFDQPGNTVEVGENLHACCWGTNSIRTPHHAGPGRHKLFDSRNESINIGGHVFYSRKAADLIEYDEEQLLGEDLLLEFTLLQLHQEGKISFWTTFASDIKVMDRANHDNVQSVHQHMGNFYYDRLVDKLKRTMNIERSCFSELPLEYPPLLFSHAEKIDWIKTVFLGNVDTEGAKT